MGQHVSEILDTYFILFIHDEHQAGHAFTVVHGQGKSPYCSISEKTIVELERTYSKQFSFQHFCDLHRPRCLGKNTPIIPPVHPVRVHLPANDSTRLPAFGGLWPLTSSEVAHWPGRVRPDRISWARIWRRTCPVCAQRSGSRAAPMIKTDQVQWKRMNGTDHHASEISWDIFIHLLGKCCLATCCYLGSKVHRQDSGRRRPTRWNKEQEQKARTSLS